MLELIRRYSHSVVVKALLTVLAATFVFCFGITDVIRRIMGRNYIVKISNVEITPEAFRAEKQRTLDMMRNRVQHIDEKTESSKILYQMIWETILNLTAQDFGLSVSDNVIEQYIGTAWKFKDEKGNFSAHLLRAFLRKVEIPEQMFIDFSRKDIKKALVMEPFKYVSPYNELDAFIKANKEKRVLTILDLNPGSFPVLETPTEEELEEFRTNNPDLFETKETRSFKILKISEKDVEKEIQITQEELQESYDFSPDKEDKSFDEMKEELMATLKNEKLEAKINDMTRQIEDSLMGGESFENVVKKFNLESTSFENVNMDNNSETEKNVIPEKYKNDILSVAFSVDEEGTDSQFFEVLDEKGGRIFLLIHLDKITPKFVAELSKISKKVTKEWRAAKKKEKALEMAAEFVEKAKSGANLMTFAAKNGRIATFTKPFDRKGKTGEKDDKKDSEAKLLEQIHKNAFSLEKSEAAYEEFSGHVVIYQLKEIVPVEDVMTGREDYHSQLSAEMSDDFYQQLINYLSKRYKMKINYDVLKEIDEDLAGGQINFDELF